MAGRLDGKVALITGAARGQGAAEAELFAAEGARVILADVLDEDGARTAAGIGDAAAYRHLDVADEEAWNALVAGIVEDHGRLDALVNNAGIYRNGPITEMDQATYRLVIEINQIGVWLGMKAVGPQMIAQRSGSVINISSTAGFRGGPGSIAYTASKFAVRGMTKVAAREWGRARAPGQLDSPRPNRYGDAAPGAGLRGGHRALPASYSAGASRRRVRGGLPRALPGQSDESSIQHRRRVRRGRGEFGVGGRPSDVDLTLIGPEARASNRRAAGVDGAGVAQEP